MCNGTEFEKNFLRDFVYFIYANHKPKLYGQFISNHFELENDVNMTPKRRLLLSALFFTCFFALLFLLEKPSRGLCSESK